MPRQNGNSLKIGNSVFSLETDLMNALELVLLLDVLENDDST